jgi:hypothetical protein
VLPILSLVLPPSEFIGLVKLANEMNDRGFASIGFQLFARKARFSERTAKSVIGEFQDRRWIECVRRGGLNAHDRGRGGRHQVNTYRALWRPYVRGQSNEERRRNYATNAQLFRETVIKTPWNGDQNEPETVQPLHRDPVRTSEDTREIGASRQSSRPPLAFRHFTVSAAIHQKYLQLRRDNEAEVLEMYRELDARCANGFERHPNLWRALDDAYERTFLPSAAAPKRSSSFLDDVNAQLNAAGGRP